MVDKILCTLMVAPEGGAMSHFILWCTYTLALFLEWKINIIILHVTWLALKEFPVCFSAAWDLIFLQVELLAVLL